MGAKYAIATGASGAALGGIAGGISAVIDGRDFWDGSSVFKTTLIDKMNPYVQQVGDLDCVGANISSLSNGEITQSAVRQFAEDNVTGGINDVKAFQYFEDITGRNVELAVPGDQSRLNILSELKTRDVSVHLNKGGEVGHMVTVNKVVNKTIVKQSGKIISKNIYYVMDPSKGGGQYKRMSLQKLMNNRNIFLIRK